jgi:2-C-methyl-D-erythritol 4-phosphate cytidylyltransferase
MNQYALIVAGGSGLRMGTEIPKQFLLLNGEPVLMHTLRKFKTCKHIVLVLPAAQIGYWNELCAKYNFTLPHAIVQGGNERFYSVLNGLNALPDEDGLVAIHDGVRPCVSIDAINEAFASAEKLGNAIVAVLSKDSLRMVDDGKSVAVDRSKYYLIQTPQVFNLSLLKKAYSSAAYQTIFTDDASVFEHAGHQINLVKGEYTNIKITTPEDLPLAELFL